METSAAKQFGPWRIVEEIGRGGMGTVYAAVRADQVFDRRAALKVVKRGIETDANLQRFRYERRILASLDHPYIARLLDAGTSTDCLPWFVMELVEGQPIDAYCRERALSMRDRCRLFLKVCEAVSYAHRSLVIHRDIKPANILVTAEGAPKLVDFGIARLLSGPAAGDTSPEQQRGEAVNTGTDVYALGVVLYEVLTGKKAGVGERAELSADLGAIAAKASEPDPACRYASVDELRNDLNRYLTGAPILARQGRLGYRLCKFVHRHCLAAVTSLVVLTAAAGGVIAIIWEGRQAELQRQRAELRRDEMVALANHSLFDLHHAIERIPGALEARKQIVATATRYVDDLANDDSNDASLQLGIAAAYARLAELRGAPPGQPSLGDWNGSLNAYRKAASILDKLLQRDPNNDVVRLRRAEVSREFGVALEVTQSTDRAAAEFARGTAVIQSILARDPANKEARIAKALLDVQNWGFQSDLKPGSSGPKYLAALPELERLAADYPRDPDALIPLAQVNGNLGIESVANDRNPDAVAYYRKAATLLERALTLRPKDTVAERALLLQYSHLSLALVEQGAEADREQAIDYARKDLAIAESLHAADPDNWVATFDLAGGYLRLSSALPDSRGDEALQLLDKAYAIFQPKVAAAPLITKLSVALGEIERKKGDRLAALERYEPALVQYRHALDHVAAGADAPGSNAAASRVAINAAMAKALAKLNRRAEAIRTLTSMLAEAEPLGDSWPSAKAKSLSWAGDAFAELARKSGRQKDWDSAAESYSNSLREWAKLPEKVRQSSRVEIEKIGQELARLKASAER